MYILVYMEITQSLEKWGNNQRVTLPKRVVEAVKVRINQPLAVTIKGRSIILTPVETEPTLAELLMGVTPEIIGGEMDWGPNVGRELDVWN